MRFDVLMDSPRNHRGGNSMAADNIIIENIDNPHELEKMFRKDPEAFAKSFSYAWEQNPDSQVLAVWYERLHFKDTATTETASSLRRDFMFMAYWLFWLE